MKYNTVMRKAYILLFFGIWIAVLPHLGFPYSWKNILGTVSGLSLVFISYIFLQESKTREVKEEKKFDNFSENKFFKEGEV